MTAHPNDPLNDAMAEARRLSATTAARMAEQYARLFEGEYTAGVFGRLVGGTRTAFASSSPEAPTDLSASIRAARADAERAMGMALDSLEQSFGVWLGLLRRGMAGVVPPDEPAPMGDGAGHTAVGEVRTPPTAGPGETSKPG